ncbi:YdcF family protein [Alloscardovia theropitheci]|uniref:YdcF family protein n=1 Tax=Alloscardovia theropitheci TaxID=2496842 RepID=UPI00196A5DB9|nr:YdcF family protein [Alloscardovia theropitheci]
MASLVYSMWRDNRSLWNPPLLIIAVFFVYWTSTYLIYSAGYGLASGVLLAIGLFAFPLASFFGSFFLVYNGIILLRREGFSLTNLLSLCVGIFLFIFFSFTYIRISVQSNLFFDYPVINIAFLYIFSTFFIFGTVFVAFLLYSMLYAFIPKRKKYDFIIIHGAGLIDGERVTPLLKKRIDKAVEAFHKSKNPEVMLIASGGRGSDEKISEAQAIVNYVIEETDIPWDRIILEDKSTTTYENLLYSKKIGEELIDNPRFLFVTNNYHVFRTSTYARRLGMCGDGLGCSTARYYIPSAFIREFFAICVRYKWFFIVAYGLLTLLIITLYAGLFS